MKKASNKTIFKRKKNHVTAVQVAVPLFSVEVTENKPFINSHLSRLQPGANPIPHEI